MQNGQNGSAMKRKAKQQRAEQRQFDESTAAIVTKYGGNPTAPLPEIERGNGGIVLRTTVCEMVAECFVCRRPLPKNQLVNVLRTRYVHLGRCSQIVETLARSSP